MMNNVENDNMTRINPRTGRNIKVGGKVWKSLTKEEQNFTNDLFKKINAKVEALRDSQKRVERSSRAEIPPPIPDDSDDEDIGGVRRFTEIGKRVAEREAYIQNILIKTKEAQDRVDYFTIRMYQRFIMETEGWN